MNKQIKIMIDEKRHVVLNFVLENDMWICSASHECIKDLEEFFDNIKLQQEFVPQ